MKMEKYILKNPGKFSQVLGITNNIFEPTVGPEMFKSISK